VTLGLATGAKLAPNAELAHRLDQIVSVGAPIIRTSIGWAQCEPQPGVFDWKRSDLLLAAIRGRGLRVCLLLQGRMDGHALDPDQVAGFGKFCAAAAERYHDPTLILGYENQNEIMLGTKYDTHPTAERYVPLQRVFYEACKPWGPPVGTSARIGNQGWMEKCYAAGIKGFFDFCTEHPYTKPLSPSESMRQQRGGWWAMHLDRQAMIANGDGDKPIWATEYGSPTGGRSSEARTERQQASDLADAANRFAKRDFLEHLFWFDAFDVAPQTSKPGDWCGLIRADGSPKRAAQTFRDLVAKEHP
jgi:endo-1,4-beta-mannosidase